MIYVLVPDPKGKPRAKVMALKPLSKRDQKWLERWLAALTQPKKRRK